MPPRYFLGSPTSPGYLPANRWQLPASPRCPSLAPDASQVSLGVPHQPWVHPGSSRCSPLALGARLAQTPAVIPGYPKQPHGPLGPAHFQPKPRPLRFRPRPHPEPRLSPTSRRRSRDICGGRRCEMCGGCVGTEYPERGTTCLEGGSFLLNFVGCAQCGRRDFVLVSNRAEGLHGGEEIVTYDHLCKNCHHLIARHEYTFSVVDDYQEYTMLCLLCGRAEDSVSILPDDPRQMTPLF